MNYWKKNKCQRVVDTSIINSANESNLWCLPNWRNEIPWLFPDYSLTFPGYIFSSKYMSKFERWLKSDQKWRIWFFKSGKRREGKKGTFISKFQSQLSLINIWKFSLTNFRKIAPWIRISPFWLGRQWEGDPQF